MSTPAALAGTGLNSARAQRRPGKPARFARDAARGGASSAISRLIADQQNYRPLRMRVGYYVMTTAAVRLHRWAPRRRDELRREMFKFPADRDASSPIDGERPFDEVARWIGFEQRLPQLRAP